MFRLILTVVRGCQPHGALTPVCRILLRHGTMLPRKEVPAKPGTVRRSALLLSTSAYVFMVYCCASSCIAGFAPGLTIYHAVLRLGRGAPWAGGRC